MSSRARRYAKFVMRRRAAILGVTAAAVGVAALGASRLDLQADFRALLPAAAPAVRALERIERRLGAVSTLYIAVEGGRWRERAKFVERMVAALRARIPRSRLGTVEVSISEERAFFERHRLLYVDLADLQMLLRRLRERVRRERARRLVVDLEERPAAAPFDLASLERKYRGRFAAYDRFPNGLFVTPDRTLQAVLVRIPASATAGRSAGRLIDEVREVVDALRPRSHGYRVRYGGDPVTAIEERDGIAQDLIVVSASCLLLVVLSLLIFFRSARFLVLVGVPAMVGALVAFGIAAAGTGELNTNTAFLGSIILGNGINFPIILLARYLEERRAGAVHGAALEVAISRTWRATAVAAAAAATAYASLMATDFCGFSQFGWIGCVGMLVSWLAAYTVGPALLDGLEAARPIRVRFRERRGSRHGGFARALCRWRRPIALIGLGLAAVAAGGAALFYADPFEYDFGKLRSRTSAKRGSSRVGARVDRIFAGTGLRAGSPIAIVVDRPEQIDLVVRALQARRDGGVEIGQIVSVHDLIPRRQKEKLAVLRRLRQLIDGKVVGWLGHRDRERIRRLRPPDSLAPIVARRLPRRLRRAFEEKDGTFGRVVYVTPKPGAASFDGKRLLAFVGGVREIQLPSGERITTSGADVIFADILEAILRDGPMATALSFAGVLLLVGFALRRGARAPVIAALLVGVAWMCGVAALVGLKINLLNFVALPITFGIGVDYAVNVARRYTSEGGGGLAIVLRETGGAVALCSLTTIIGYGTLLFADTRALGSFGLAAVIGELTTLVAALCWMPAVLGRSRGADGCAGGRPIRGEVRSEGPARSGAVAQPLGEQLTAE